MTSKAFSKSANAPTEPVVKISLTLIVSYELIHTPQIRLKIKQRKKISH